ncbi:hypothetical protein CERSUDRAFT_108595 [Gelatoporia subvermispora B]|uniref:DUF6534 domain-containing protein n=1 Tax=Ceriporiopsis subvermispora (strain B) TaxID=914234 RepID=M2PB37_CERS8|nr:hypothetical protein CERSUDRAFT_108595 [Gelatoporia subvermispora B]
MSSSTIPSDILHSKVEPSIGGSLLGMILSIMFYGVTVLQTFIYYDNYWRDPIYMRIFVVLLFVLDTAQVVAIIDTVWFYVVPNFGNVAALSGVHLSLGVEIGMTISIGLLVQSFFAMRVWLMSGRKLIFPALIFALTLAQFSLGIYYATIADRIDQPEAIEHTVIKVALASLACGMAGDFFITACLVYYLHKGRSGLRNTDRLINILIMYTINTGLVTFFAATCTIILNQVKSTEFWDVVPYFLLSKCYVNSTLATLNARGRLRNMSSGVGTETAQLDMGYMQDGHTTTAVIRNRPSDPQITSGIQFAKSAEMEMTESKVIESIFVPEF